MRTGGRERVFIIYISSGTDSSVWQKDTSKYGIAQTYESQAMCSVVVASKFIEIIPLISPPIFTIFVVRFWQNIPPGAGGPEHLQ